MNIAGNVKLITGSKIFDRKKWLNRNGQSILVN